MPPETSTKCMENQIKRWHYGIGSAAYFKDDNNDLYNEIKFFWQSGSALINWYRYSMFEENKSIHNTDVF